MLARWIIKLISNVAIFYSYYPYYHDNQAMMKITTTYNVQYQQEAKKKLSSLKKESIIHRQFNVQVLKQLAKQWIPYSIDKQ
jgi:hypothetical protein